MKKLFVFIGAIIAFATSEQVLAQPKTVKIGFVATFSGPLAVIGNDMRNSFNLALDHLNHTMGGLPVQLIYEDDQQKPEIGMQKTKKLIESDHVDFITGYIFSNVLLASLQPAVDSKTILISAHAGPSQLAGELCSPYVYTTGVENDQTAAAMGLYMNQKGVKNAYVLSPNYAAGKDIVAGLKSTFQGKIVGEEYTRWPDQLDFSTELSNIRAVRPDAVFAFYPGAAGVQFLNQYEQSGLKGKTPLYTVFTIDETTLPLQGTNAISRLLCAGIRSAGRVAGRSTRAGPPQDAGHHFAPAPRTITAAHGAAEAEAPLPAFSSPHQRYQRANKSVASIRSCRTRLARGWNICHSDCVRWRNDTRSPKVSIWQPSLTPHRMSLPPPEADEPAPRVGAPQHELKSHK